MQTFPIIMRNLEKCPECLQRFHVEWQGFINSCSRNANDIIYLNLILVSLFYFNWKYEYTYITFINYTILDCVTNFKSSNYFSHVFIVLIYVSSGTLIGDIYMR
jgi:hypothetical protein